jgi:hypothetical protein
LGTAPRLTLIERRPQPPVRLARSQSHARGGGAERRGRLGRRQALALDQAERGALPFGEVVEGATETRGHLLGEQDLLAGRSTVDRGSMGKAIQSIRVRALLA